MKNYFSRAVFFVFVLYSTIPARAKSTENSIQAYSINPVYQDNIAPDVFINQAVLYGMKAIQMGGLASKKATNPKLKAIGEMMIDQYSKSNQELIALAKTKNIALPMTKPQGGQRPDGRVDSAPENLRDTSRNQNQGEAGNSGTISKSSANTEMVLTDSDLTQSVESLNKRTDKAFDEAYINATTRNYKGLIALYEAGAKSKDKSIRSFSSKSLPAIKKQLAEISQIK
ncbi:hypothetical protein DHW03_05520 [Pedobacter yonginense]|uniref:DUF4142 domain-containing protein n=1 Tax=Pedobacter yonginense TaxID=651869 RepID=A0A317ET81_9SPHI|nr:DUF4142 domain-containing protein [Pedobacter yonginense]PWS29277.1 hypothetical protein DHW03_05520 [Pedobacter yonginense]